MPALDRKAASVFAGKVVRKDLVRKVKVGANVPVFVLEYLLGKYCATDDPVAIDAGLKVVNNTLSSNFVRPDEANKAQSMVKDKGKHTLIDKVQVSERAARGEVMQSQIEAGINRANFAPHLFLPPHVGAPAPLHG